MLLAVVERLVGVDARLVVLLNLLDTDRVCVCLCVCSGGEPAAGAAGGEGWQRSGGGGAAGGGAVGPGHRRLQVNTCVLEASRTMLQTSVRSLLSFDASEELPSLDHWQCATPLDRSLRHIRVLHLQQIVSAALALKHGPATELSTVMDQAEDWASRLRAMAEEVCLYH